jgi:hypothetical protein
MNGRRFSCCLGSFCLALLKRQGLLGSFRHFSRQNSMPWTSPFDERALFAMLLGFVLSGVVETTRLIGFVSSIPPAGPALRMPPGG